MIVVMASFSSSLDGCEGLLLQASRASWLKNGHVLIGVVDFAPVTASSMQMPTIRSRQTK